MIIFNFKAISTKHLFTNKKIALVSVINDLNSDVRVNKIALTLIECGYNVTLIGRVLPRSKPFQAQAYKGFRMRLIFKKGPLFYLFFNLRLFFKLLFTKAHLLYANDLDTLLPNYLVSKIKGIPLIYDSHELFCGVPELLQHPIKRGIWLSLEKWLLPKLNHLITVSDGIATFYQNKYQKSFTVVRNIPPAASTSFALKSREALGIPLDKKMILLQGAGINIDRGAEELIDAMAMVHNAVIYIIGSGDVWQVLEQKVKAQGLEAKVKLIQKLPKEELLHYTGNADIGLSIDKNTNLNYYYSLPNKLFDYIQCSVPVLASRLHEIEKIIDHYQIGEFIDSHEPKHLAKRLNAFVNSEKLSLYRQNMQKAVQELNWTIEKQKLIAVIQKATKPNSQA